MPQTYEIPLSKLEAIMKRLKRAKPRNARNGLPTPSVEIISRSFKEIEVRDALARLRGGDTDTRTIRLATAIISVDGFAARVGEWDITGYRWSRSVTSAAGQRIRYTGNSEGVPREIGRRPELECDHCSAKRGRTSSFVVGKVDGTGSPVEVGATCLSAFLGHPSQSVLGGLTENGLILEEIQRLAAEKTLSEDDVVDEVDTILAVACNIISAYGFVSTRDAGPEVPATWTAVYEDVRLYRSAHLDDSDLSVTASDFMAAGEVIAWARSHEASAVRSPFMDRVLGILDEGVSNPGDVAVLTALVASHRRHLVEAERRLAAAEVSGSSSHVGLIGDRGNFVCSVESVKPYNSRFGEGDVVTFLDGSGNLMTWFSSGRSHGLEVGKTYEIVGTVKEHKICERGAYEGAAQTIVNRIKVVQDLGISAPRPRHDPEKAEADREFDQLIGFLAPTPR